MSEIAIQTIPITTTGEAGAATGSATSIPITGFLLDVYLNYNAAAPATTDVTITDPTFGDIVAKSNNATDCKLAPRQPLCGATASLNGLYDLVPLNSALTITVEDADALTDCVIITLRWITP